MTQLKLFGSKTQPTLQLFRKKGVKRLFIKNLAVHQDNDKNQIFLSTSLDGIANALRAQITFGQPSYSNSKKASSKGVPKLEAFINWVWLEDGYESPAPKTKLIYYFQYPEVRLSGFLRNSPRPPDALRRRHMYKYGRRTLLFGMSGSIVYGTVLTGEPGTDYPVITSAKASPISDVLMELHLNRDDAESTITALLGIWHPAVKLKTLDATPNEFTGNQAPGYTLEALCGIPANAFSGPDLFGAELKSFRFSSKVTLMTPVADGGEWRRLQAREYLHQYGHTGRDGHSLRFTGAHRVGNSTNGRTLVLKKNNEKISQTQSVDLIRESDQRVLESWSVEKIVSSWLKKHDAAFYVKYKYDRQQNQVIFDGYFKCKYTSPERLLNSIKSGLIYYDPAHTLKENAPLKVRPQWRVSTAKKYFEARLRDLYVEVEAKF